MDKNKKVIELGIDEYDEVSGVDMISIVDEPAIEINFLAFNKQKKEDRIIIPDGEDDKYLKFFDGKGESEEEMLNDGWEIDSMTEMSKEEFGLKTAPNSDSVQDGTEFRIRYKYDLRPNIRQERIIPTTREYCRTLINRNFVFRYEDVMSLPPNNDPFDGGFSGPPYKYSGGFNCRHQWFKMTYKREGRIVNKASVNTNKVLDEASREIAVSPDWNQTQVIPNKVRNNPSSSTIKNLGLSKQKISFDSDKRIVIGPAMVPDMEIVRVNQEGEEYFVTFSKETIRIIAEKYMRNKFTDNNDVMHNGKPINSNYVIETWIKETPNDKSNDYGYDLPIGTWFVKMKINDEPTWQKIKNGELKGFSVSGYFAEMEEEINQEFLNELAKLLNMRKN